MFTDVEPHEKKYNLRKSSPVLELFSVSPSQESPGQLARACSERTIQRV